MFLHELTLCEAKVFISIPYRKAKEEVFYQNPTLAELRQMTKTKDLRGITDGKNVFVWSADNLIHGMAAQAIFNAAKWSNVATGTAIDYPRYDPNRDCFYLFNPEVTGRGNDSSEWVQHPEVNEIIELAPDLAVAIVRTSRAYLSGIAPFARLIRNVPR